MARLDPKLIQQGEESLQKKVKLKGHTSFGIVSSFSPNRNSTTNTTLTSDYNENPLQRSEVEEEQGNHRHEFIIYEDDTVEILPYIEEYPEDGELLNSKESHTHTYIGFWPNGFIEENDQRGITHKHKIIGAQEKIQIIQPMYNDVSSVIDTSFSEIFSGVDNKIPTIVEFFRFYQRLFYNIPKEGVNSHTFLINESLGYVNNYAEPNSEEILELTNRIVELEKEIAEKDSLDKEHPIFQNGTFLKDPDNATVYYMDKGQKRAIDNMEVFNILKRVNGHSPEEPNEEVIILVTEDVIKGLETGPKFRSEDLYGDEEKRQEEEAKKLVKLDPDDFIADPNNYETVDDYLVALDRETRQLLAKEEYLQELYYRYKSDSEDLFDVEARKRAKEDSKTYLGELSQVRRKILRYTDILEAVDPDGNLQNLEIDKSKLKSIVEDKSSRTNFSQAELQQLRSKKNTIERFLDSDKSVPGNSNQTFDSSSDPLNTGTGAGNNTAAYLKAAGMGEAAGYGAEEQPESPPKGFSTNPTGLVKNHTVQEAINAMQLGRKSPQGNWYWSFKVNNKHKVTKGKETGKWTHYLRQRAKPIPASIGAGIGGIGGHKLAEQQKINIYAVKPASKYYWSTSKFEWAPVPGSFPGVKSRNWQGKTIHKLNG